MPSEADRVERRLAAILAADVAGYGRLMGQDEAGTLARLKSLRREVIDPEIAEHRGRIVKTTGDGILVEFPSVVEAVACALAVQQGMAERNAAIPENQRVWFRVGIHQGDIIVEGDDIFGDGVNVAARLEALAEPGGICVSARVQEDAVGRLDLTFDDLGTQRLKNIARAVRVYRARSQGAAVTIANQAPSLPEKPSIAVLPFQNMSGDPEREYFADGMVEEIITALSCIRWLFVIARNSSFTYKGKAVDVKQVARELGVRYVLEGSVRKAGNRVRITGSAMGLSEWGEVRGDIRARVIGQTNAGRALLAQGELPSAGRLLDEAYELYQANLDDQSAIWTLRVALTRPVLLSHLLGNLAVVTCLMGFPEKVFALLMAADQPHQREDEATVVAKPLIQWYRLLVLSFLVEPSELLEPAQQLAAVSDEQGLPTFIAWATAIRGYAMAGSGDPLGGRALVAEGLAGYLATQAELWSCYFRVLLADAQMIAGEPDAALDVLAEALEKNRHTGERWCDPEIYRRMGEALRKREDDGRAEEYFRKAIDVADAAGMKLWKLTAANSYARLLCDRGEHESARALLSPIYSSFSDGIQIAPLRRASILLAEAGPQ